MVTKKKSNELVNIMSRGLNKSYWEAYLHEAAVAQRRLEDKLAKAEQELADLQTRCQRDTPILTAQASDARQARNAAKVDWQARVEKYSRLLDALGVPKDQNALYTKLDQDSFAQDTVKNKASAACSSVLRAADSLSSQLAALKVQNKIAKATGAVSDSMADIRLKNKLASASRSVKAAVTDLRMQNKIAATKNSTKRFFSFGKK